MPSENEERFYYPALDGLRFIAFLLVFIHNAQPILSNSFLNKLSEYGWIGVDLFFCLSAFLLTKLLLLEHKQNGKINIRNFYIRRALRIGPLYFLYVAIAMIFLAPLQGKNLNIPLHVAGLGTFTFNFVYFALLPSPILAVIHLWAISFEAQFYVVIPWFARFVAEISRKSKWLVLLLVFAAGISARALFIYFQFKHPAVYFLPFTHFDSILGGAAIGMGLLDGTLRKIPGWATFVFAATGFTLVFLLPNNDVTSWGLMLTYLLTGVAAVLLIAAVAIGDSKYLKAVLGSKILAYLGKVSYGLYIFHPGALALAYRIVTASGETNRQSNGNDFRALLLGLLLAIVFSTASFQMIEKPFLKRKRFFSQVLSGSG